MEWLRVSNSGLISINGIASKFPSVSVLDIRSNELMMEGDFDPLIEMEELADVGVSGNPLSSKIK